MTVLMPPPLEFDQPPDYRDEIAARANGVRFLVIPERRYLLIDGTGTPGGPEFGAAMAALYPTAYTLHFALKKRGLQEPIGALEGVYRLSSPAQWRLQLPVPASATSEDIDGAIEQVRARSNPPTIDRLVVEPCAEGKVAQIMHVGPYGAEAATIERLRVAIEARGLRPRGDHHEIYISDPNRTAAARLKTVIRQPVEAPGQ